MKAKDICFTIDAILNPANDVPWADDHREVLAGCEVEDDKTAVVRFHHEVDIHEQWLGFAVLPSHVFDDNPVIPRDHPFSREAFGTLGIRAQMYDDRVTFDAPEHLQRPVIKHWELRPMPEPEVAVQDLLSGKVQGIIDVPPEFREQIWKGHDYHLKSYDQRQTWFIGVSPTLSGPKIREAIDLSIDRQAVRKAISFIDPDDPNPPIEVVSGPWVGSSPYYNRAVKPRDADPKRAAELRREAGWPIDRTLVLGVRERDAQHQPKFAGAIVDNLRAAGWAVEVRSMAADDSGEGIDLVLASHTFDMPDNVEPIFRPGGAANPWGATHPYIAEKMSEIRHTARYSEAEEASKELHAWLANDRSLLPLFKLDTKSAWTNDIRGNIIGPRHYFTAFGMWKYDP